MALPSGYTKLDYIESSGTQYINTGFKPNQNTRVVMDVEVLGTTQCAPFGARASQNGTTYTLFLLTATTGRTDYGTSKQAMTFSSILGRYTIDANKNVVNVNGVSITHTASTFSVDHNIFLLAVNTAGTASNFAKVKLYSCKIYDNGTLVRDFIPCKNANGTLGLWDNVNSVFYANAGTGTFSTGTKHKTLIGGTGYEIKSGRVLIAGTGYDIKKGRTLIGGTGYDIKFATPIGELIAGTIVYMNVDGTRTPYIVVHQGNPDTTVYGASCNGTWVLMQNIYSLTKWQARQNSYYHSSDCLVRQLAQSFPSKLDAVIQNNLIPLKLLNIEYSWEDISGDKVFPLTSNDLSNMDYFSDGAVSKRIATYNGAATGYWLRDPDSYGAKIKYITASGTISTRDDNSYLGGYKGQGFRPMYILNTASLVADSDFNIVEP